MNFFLSFGVFVGILLLLLGRKVFWLALAVLGFFIGFHFTSQFTHGLTQEMSLFAAVIGGLVGLAISFWLPKMAAAVGGFFLGFILALYALPWLGLEGPLALVLVLGVALLFAFASTFILQTAISLSTSFAGALMITHSVPWFRPWEVLAILLLGAFGFFFQMRGKPRKLLTPSS